MNSELGNAELGNFELGQLGVTSITLTPGAGSITYTPGTPTVNVFSKYPGAGAIAYTGGTPVVTLSAFTLSPGAGHITYTGATPTVSFSGTITIAPGAGTITLTGGTPVLHLDTDLVLYPDTGTIHYTSGTPTLTFTLFPGAATIIYTPGAPGVSLVRTTGTGNQLFIGSTDFSCFWRESTFKTTKQLSGNWSAEFELNYYGGTRPTVGQEVAMFWQSNKRFGGLIQSISEVGQQGTPGRFSILQIKAGGFQLLTDRVIIAKLFTLFLGGLPGIIVYEIWREKLRQFGVTAPSGGFGSAIVIGEQLFHYITVTEAFNRVKAQDPGHDWWIDDNLLLHYERTDAGLGATAPFTLRDGDGNVDFMTVTKSDVRFRNRQWVLPSADLAALRTDSDLGDGVTTNFETVYSLGVKPIVTVDGVEQLVTELGNWITGWQFYYILGGIGVFARTAPALGTVVAISYPNPWPLAYSAQNDASIAAVGLYEAVWQAKNVFDKETALIEAQGLLDLYMTSGFETEIEFEYNSNRQPLWLLPGEIMDIIHTFPSVSGLFTIEQVVSQEIKKTVWKHTVTLRAGLGEVTDAQALEAYYRTPARVPIDSPPKRLTAELFTDLPGITNPGASIGVIKNTYPVQAKGVLNGWDILAQSDPPTGASFILDALLNGISIFTQQIYTDLVIDAIDNTKITSVAHPFSASSVGQHLVVSPGVTGFTPQTVTVISVAGSAAIMSAAMGTLGSGGGQGILSRWEDKIVAAAGVTIIQRGIRFAVENTVVLPGDIITLSVLQVGSINPGKNFTVHINIKVFPNAGQA